MPAELAPILALLLHEGGWDEVLMVAVGLGLAYVVIVWTGRRQRDDEDDDEGDEGLDDAEARSSEGPADTPRGRRP